MESECEYVLQKEQTVRSVQMQIRIGSGLFFLSVQLLRTLGRRFTG